MQKKLAEEEGIAQRKETAFVFLEKDSLGPCVICVRQGDLEFIARKSVTKNRSAQALAAARHRVPASAIIRTKQVKIAHLATNVGLEIPVRYFAILQQRARATVRVVA